MGRACRADFGTFDEVAAFEASPGANEGDEVGSVHSRCTEPGSAGRAPKNRTDATATAFLNTDCQGDTYYTLPPGTGASDRLLLRSVVFS
ncbi:hypothetical protein ACZ91_67850 [Streptomyces regensis]|nr:hypothetical protein ACZ91_67850 [Streptomyces regensis]